MSNCNTILSVLTSNGSDQKQRYLNALQPENIRLNDFELTDWVLFAHNFSEYVNYFETSNSETPSGDWKAFFDFFKLNEKPSIENQLILDRIKKELADLIAESQKEYAITPHLTLFLTFLKLLENSKKRYNNLTKRHLDFYYSQILNINKLPATPDKVYMIFELAKNAIQEKIEAKTGFDGGKDASGKTRNYYSNNELIANKTVVSSLKNIYNDVDTKKIVASPIANSYDGLGVAFPDKNNTQWWPFGYVDTTNVLPELPNAVLGFAVASPILSLAEGKRSVQMSFTFHNNITNATTAIIRECLSLQLTTAKKWFEVAEISQSLPIKSGGTYTTSVSGKTMKIAFLLDENADAITGYDPKIYGEEFATDLPVVKFNLDTTKANGYDLYKSLAQNKLENIVINIDVQNIKSAVLENDNGSINAAKPFFPFSPQPVDNSNFLIKYSEAFTKKWENINIDVLWKNTPVDFVEHYKAYKTTALNTISVGAFKSSVLNASNNFENSGGIVTTNSYFQYQPAILSNNIWQNYGSAATLFTATSPFKTTLNIANSNYITEKNGQLKLTLTKSFLHRLYPKIYALALSADDANVVIPNEPYTPLAESLVLNYTASETTKFSVTGTETLEGIYTKNKAKLFQIHPFGYAEEHSYLKSLLDYVESENSYLFPTYCKGGELFIGLENVQELQQITLLFQVLEGSENPLTSSFTGKQKIEWSVLGNNEWRILNYSDILLNETDNLLQSGILKFSLPKEATQNNTRLPKNYIWLKAKMHKKYDAVCKIIGIHSQAVLSTFQVNSNDLSHLKTGLEAGTISKLLQRLSNVKSVTQPYNSFDYKPEESNEDYYRRISERLRHKNRAITMWDYEHIILQKFPELYKVKCLNHTCETSYQSPGNVTLVVIPDTVNKNVFDIFQPRVSTATLNKVKNHIDQLNSMHITTFVINPKYEEVTVDLKVKFRPGYDENFYLQELNTDIIKFLSPWALDKNVPITFGVTIHSSLLINYIEKLGYVDYLQDVKLLKNGALSDKVAVPSNPKSILVSAKSHVISTDVKQCTVKTIEPQEECQL